MIEIVTAENVEKRGPGGHVFTSWVCWLEISQGPESYMLPTTAPGDLDEGDLQAHFDAREAELWAVAQAKQYPVDLFERVPVKRVLKAFALVVLDEVNILRGAAGLPERTANQIITAIKGKL